MSDSLDKFIERAGEKIGSIYNKKINPDGTNFFSGKYFGPNGGGVPKTDGSDAIGQSKNPNPSPGQKSPAKSLQDEKGKSYPAGFTPLIYYRTGKEVTIIPVGDKILKMGDKNEENSASFNGGVGIGGTTPGGKNGVMGFDDPNQYDFKYSLDKYENWPEDSPPLKPTIGKNDSESFDGSFSDKSWEKMDNYEFNKNAVNWSKGTPHENEDPVYFGFEIILDSLNSPLLNGELLKFLTEYEGYEEIGSRIEILQSFQTELSKFFKFNSPKLEESNRFGTKINKRHYIKKIAGLDKLIESNGTKDNKSFVKYKDDTIKISFYEDSLLSTGTLASLYKILYWSKINGKSIIPENLLRFDCEIVVSEVRNISRVRKSISGESNLVLEVLKENVSRYVYKAYECQVFFQNMSHPNEVDLETHSPSSNFDIEMNFKFSDMRFERFVFDGDYGSYKFLSNRTTNPIKISPQNADDIIVESDQLSLVIGSSVPIKTSSDINFLSNLESTPNTDSQENILEDLKENDKKTKLGKIIQRVGDSALESLETFKENIKTAALSEAQRQINDQFRLLNNTIDKVRNAYGIGRMSEPTNVYKDFGNGNISPRFFFDVRNSLRGFAGDFLGGLIDRRS